ncbi:C-type lectin 37Da-like [Drosophila novamexicana]|uniref:C-type lectin 37Da-like n=1 Tax=Drosophila novamexicana TaxID=47314 RepID=UPI0011E5FB9C|nr:C-type lectin 37Da-like [Drosophila novamexicana]
MLCHQLAAFTILSLALIKLHLVVVSSQSVAASCDTEFTQVGDKCVLHESNAQNWFEAYRNCRSKGARLLTLDNDSQLEQINNWLNEYRSDVWTSGNNLSNKGAYYWQSTGKLASYLPWSTGQPQAANGDCLLLLADHSLLVLDYRLAVENCSTLAPYICEQEPRAFETRVCLKPTAFDTAQVVVN